MAAPPAAERTKAVLRNLPPLAQEKDIQALVDAEFKDKCTWFSFVQGKISTKRVVKSHAYVNFANPGDVLAFKAAVHGHAFVSDRGVKYKCSVEYAPFQRVPKTTTKADPREGTIEQDTDFLAFAEHLQEAPVAPKGILSREAASAAEPEQKAEPKVTALMREIEARRASKAKSLYTPKRPQRSKAGLFEADITSRSDKDVRGTRAVNSARAQGPDNSSRSSKDDHRSRSESKRDRARAQEAAQAAAEAVTGRQHAEEDAAGDTALREQKPVRMRAGFGVFQPSRVGRLMDESADANGAATAGKSAPRASSRGSSSGTLDIPATASQAKSGGDARMSAAVAEAMRKPNGSRKDSRAKLPISPRQDRPSIMPIQPSSPDQDATKAGNFNGSEASGLRKDGRHGNKRGSRGKKARDEAPSPAGAGGRGPKKVAPG